MKLLIFCLILLSLSGCTSQEHTTKEKSSSTVKTMTTTEPVTTVDDEKILSKTALKETTQQPLHKPLKSQEQNTQTMTKNIATIYAEKCASCHGKKAELSALSRSEIISKWDKKQIEDALFGYQDGSYGKTMKALMQAQVTSLDTAQIKALSDYISNL